MRVAIAALIVTFSVVARGPEGRAQAPVTSPKRLEGSAPAALPEPLTREALRDLLACLSDAQVREL
jgi:hypothetical protein